MKITHANQVWCTDITYIPMAKGFMYLTAIIDVYSRKIVGWGISNSMSKQWVLSVLKEAIARHGKPEIINTDQGSQYTSFAWTHFLEEQGIKISMDSKGRAIDNIWIERFWKSIKYNYIYLNPCDNGLELFEGVKEYIDYYNRKKHQTIKKNQMKHIQNLSAKKQHKGKNVHISVIEVRNYNREPVILKELDLVNIQKKQNSSFISNSGNNFVIHKKRGD